MVSMDGLIVNDVVADDVGSGRGGVAAATPTFGGQVEGFRVVTVSLYHLVESQERYSDGSEEFCDNAGE